MEGAVITDSQMVEVGVILTLCLRLGLHLMFAILIAVMDAVAV